MTRIHQIFIHGHTIDCNSRQEDYINCLKWKKEKDINAAVIYFNIFLFILRVYISWKVHNLFVLLKGTLVQSEKNKISNRWKSFYANNVWETRTSPPENWNEQLPDYILQRRPNSTFKDTLDEYNDQNNKSFCSIMWNVYKNMFRLLLILI